VGEDGVLTVVEKFTIKGLMFLILGDVNDNGAVDLVEAMFVI